MKPLARDILLRRIKLLEHQYVEQLAAIREHRSLLERFTAAAERIRAHAAEGDVEFVDVQLRCVMATLGLIPSEVMRCPEPRPMAHRGLAGRQTVEQA